MMANACSGRRGESFDRLVRQEELILDVTERLTEALQEAGMTQAELARRLDRTPGFVSQVLGGGRNLTLRTISDIAAALDLRPAFELSSDHEALLEEVQWTDKFPRWTQEILGSVTEPPTSAAHFEAEAALEPRVA